MENIIFDYLQGNLDESQKRDFEQRLETDQEFFQEFQVVKQMYSHLLERKDREVYTAEIEKLGTKYFPPEAKRGKLSMKMILFLTIVILTTLLTAWYLLSPKNVNLYDSHSDHFALHLVLKSDENSIAINAENAFNKGDFEAATIAIQKYLESNAIDTKARLALGISYLEMGNYEDANKIFDEIRNGKSALKDHATWYKALYYIKISEYSPAKEMINLIPKADAQLYEKGQKLLEDIADLEERNSE